MRRGAGSVFCAAAMLCATAKAGPVLYVDDDAPAGGNGASWPEAYRFLNDALAAAAPGSGVTELRVAQGTYFPDRVEASPGGTADRSATFQLVNGVALLGGFAGLGGPDPDARDADLYETILSGNIGNPGSALDNSYHVVTGTGADLTASFEGFTIAEGRADSTVDIDYVGAGMTCNPGMPAVVGCRFSGNWAVHGGGIFVRALAPHVIDCTFTGNTAFNNGGGIYAFNGAGPHIEGSSFINNTSQGGNGGGAMGCSGGSPQITNCTFAGNTAGTAGALDLMNAISVVSNCAFTGNSASYDGGALRVYQGSLTAANCQFTGNMAGNAGGACATAGNVSLTGSGLSGNSAPWAGGGIYHSGGTLTMSGCTLEGNEADDGGGLRMGSLYNPVDATFSGCTFQDNEAADSGGGAYILDVHPVFTGCTFIGNAAILGTGGAMHNEGGGPTLRSCWFENNTAGWAGGGVYNDECPDAAIAGCRFIGNAAVGNPSSGGGLYNAACDATIINCAFAGNTSTGWAGGVENFNSSPLMINCLFSGNHAEKLGGGLYNIINGDAVLLNCTFWGNSAGQLGGGVYNWSSHPQLLNCIAWGNLDGGREGIAAQVHDDAQSAALISYSCLQGWNGPGGPGNTGEDPMLADPPGPDGVPGTADDDLRLLPGSPGIDAADGTVVLGCLLDLGGSIRRADDPDTPDSGPGGPPALDMGAYEFGSPAPPDCNDNLLDDLCEQDCNKNTLPDDCELDQGLAFDCNGSGVLDDCDIADGTSLDCNANAVPDECDLAGGTSAECNGNGIPDECDIAAGTSPDCNGNGIPDECDLGPGLGTDCNVNGVPDECEAAGHDCNGNGVPDACDTATTYYAASGELSPIGYASPQTFLLLAPPAAAGDVTLTLTASADLDENYEKIDVYLDGVFVGDALGPGGSLCPAEPDVGQVLVSAVLYNAIRTSYGPDITIMMVGSILVDPAACGGASFAAVQIQYPVAQLVPDLNGNGIPDACEAAGDLNGDGSIGINDLLILLTAWGPCAAPCPPACAGDLDGDCAVGITDFLSLLKNWG